MCLLPPNFAQYPIKLKNAHDGSGFRRWVVAVSYMTWYQKQDYDMAPENSLQTARINFHPVSFSLSVLSLLVQFNNAHRSNRHDVSHIVHKYVKTHCCMCWSLNKMQAASELVSCPFLLCCESKMLCSLVLIQAQALELKKSCNTWLHYQLRQPLVALFLCSRWQMLTDLPIRSNSCWLRTPGLCSNPSD